MGWLDGVGWVGSFLLVLSLMQARVVRFRALNLVACVILVGFNAAIEVWPMVAMNVVLAGINIYFLVRLVGSRHDDAVFEVIEVSPSDEYLRHLLRVRGSDISTFQPGFLWDIGRTDQHAYLVLRGDETVGVVLVRDEGDGTAQVLLDYVTPRFRDFSPGEFLWRRSGLLKESGFTRVLSPPGMVAPYYDKVGFSRVGDSYALDL